MKNKINKNNGYSDIKWVELSKKIKKRDKYKCTECESKKELQVHHKRYYIGENLWDVEPKYLQTLCNECHLKKHINIPIIKFYKHRKKKKKSTISKKINVSSKIIISVPSYLQGREQKYIDKFMKVLNDRAWQERIDKIQEEEKTLYR